MAKHRECPGRSGSAGCIDCTGPCPYETVAEPELRAVRKNGTMHLCDGSGELFFPTGEGPGEDLQDGRGYTVAYRVCRQTGLLFA